ncbi:Dor1-domain-containing protein [Macrolepiota fuliginosa MF-IS2]|uniref:Conserved oligomeric Golgi complex subunit 8 n=1 Tax=Macrolepiota fuliginosa MF-IS2 TaxID=1400762 RepID=A0A9P5X7V5_9AGAR|nr:Dor1-domain-containing protein [Macrolepiota fuliginosa MF-IS2]
MDGPPTLVASHLADASPLADILTEQSPSPQLLVASTSKGYLSHLATLPLTELVQEPVSLQTQSHHLTSSLTSFTHTSYPTFISLHKTTTALASSIESLSSSLNDLLETSLPSLEESTGAWKSRTEAVLRERNKARVVLEQHEKIRDLLDIPILIDTCVRNGYFGEALSLASHVTTLANRPDDKHKDRLPPPVILTSVLSEVQHSIMQMHSSLLSTLYDPSRKLPALWKAVNFLRKMDAFGSNPSLLRLGSLPHLKPIRSSSQDSPTRGRCPEPSSEEQLALAFLIGRESCLKTILETSRRDIQRLAKEVTANELDTDTQDGSGSRTKSKGKEKELDEREKEDLARYLKKYIDSWREGVYDIITQYATIFLERSSTHPETPTNTDDEDFSRLHTLLRTYATRALSTHLFSIIRPSLPLLALSRLPSLLTQLTYCSTAFARLGLDFQFTLTAGGGLFSTAILSIIKRDFDSASEKWIQRIRKARGSTVKPGSRMSAYSPRAAAGPAELPSKWLVLPSLATSPPVPPSSTKRGSGSNGPPHIPPQILASYPPLAELTNAVLGVLNGLRLLVPRHPGTVNGSSTTVSAEPRTQTEGVYELLRMLDEIILTHGSSALVEYLNLVMASLKDEDEEKVKVKEREERVVGAAGRVFFDVFVVFVRRALVEGVYGLELDGVGAKGKGGEDLGWVGKREEFERLVIDLGGDESEEDEEDEDEDEDEDGDGDGEE